jgi:chemotaxis protein CheC
VRGEAIVLFDVKGGRALSDLLGYGEAHDESAQEELLLDVSNILLGAVINGMGVQIGARFGFQPPTILARGADLPRLLEPGSLCWCRALLIEVDFAVACRDFKCHLVLLMPEDAIERMRGVLDRRLAAT